MTRPGLHFVLGAIVGGRVYLFSGLGDFRTPAAARDYYKSAPRTETNAVIVAQWDARKHGITYGTHTELLSLADLQPVAM